MERKENKVGIKGWLALIVLCIMFSGILKNVDGPLKALDFSNLVGSWGVIGESGQNFIGKGGTGAREGMMQALSLIPAPPSPLPTPEPPYVHRAGVDGRPLSYEPAAAQSARGRNGACAAPRNKLPQLYC